jgi:hypothetical protein
LHSGTLFWWNIPKYLSACAKILLSDGKNWLYLSKYFRNISYVFVANF